MTSGIDFSGRRRGLPRWVGGLLAFVYPLTLVAVALSVGFNRTGDMSDLAASVLAWGQFLIAAPTAWVFTPDFIEAGHLLIVVSALATSLPLWFMVGSRLAFIANDWLTWLRRYVTVCIVWSVCNVLLFVVIGSVAG